VYISLMIRTMFNERRALLITSVKPVSSMIASGLAPQDFIIQSAATSADSTEYTMYVVVNL